MVGSSSGRCSGCWGWDSACYFPFKVEAASLPGVAGVLSSLAPRCTWASERWPAQLGNGLCRLVRGDIGPSHGQEGWEGLGNSPVICFLLLCNGVWEGKLMTGQAFYLTPAHALSCRPCVTSVSAFVCPWDPGNADFLFSPAPGSQRDCKK